MPIIPVQALLPGLTLNRLVAQRVMGWHEWVGDDDYEGPYPMFQTWGENDGAALAFYRDDDPDVERYVDFGRDQGGDFTEIIHHLNAEGWHFVLSNIPGQPDDWSAGFTKDVPLGREIAAGRGKSMAHAVCLAALKAKGVTEVPA